MRKDYLLGVALAALLASAISANAGPIIIDISGSGSGISLQGVASATQVSPGVLHLDTFIGTQTVGTSVFNITGLLPFAASDQILVGQPNSLVPTQNGIAFGTDFGGRFNIGSADGVSVVELIESLIPSGQPSVFQPDITFDASIRSDGTERIPEPVTLSLFSVGGACTWILRRRKMAKAA